MANAQAEQKVISAKAEAEAILAEAQAQADANKLLEQSLTNKVIAYEQIQKWNGVMPKVTGSDGGMLINVDLDDINSSSTYNVPEQQSAEPTEQNSDDSAQ